MTSAFKIGTVGCSGQFTFPGFLVRGSLSGVFPTIFVLYLNNLPSEALPSTSYSNRLYIGMTTWRSSAMSINMLLTFEMDDLNEALLLNATFFSALSFSFAAAAKRSIKLQQYMHQ